MTDAKFIADFASMMQRDTPEEMAARVPCSCGASVAAIVFELRSNTMDLQKKMADAVKRIEELERRKETESTRVLEALKYG